jgi:hypothetical protein
MTHRIMLTSNAILATLSLALNEQEPATSNSKER